MKDGTSGHRRAPPDSSRRMCRRPRRRPLPWRRRTPGAYLRSNHGGAILVGGAIVISLMTGTGALMSNYAWREAQWEELRAASRAAVSVAGPLLGGAGGALDAQIKTRVAAFASSLVGGLTVDAADVAVSYDADADVTTVVVGGDYDFDNIWIAGGGETPVSNAVRVRLEFERYEVAMALDVSVSMLSRMPDGEVRKLDALKAAVAAVTDTLESSTATTPGSVMISIVPYSSAVNVADTCRADPATGVCRAGRSPGKERYVRMLAGAGGTMEQTLARARKAREDNAGGHWVDTFHHYGAGARLGSLRRQYLPKDLLDDRDWNLRRQNREIDVSNQVPALGVWTVDDEDFWNGCVMARWGAYWNPAARPAGWTRDDPANWPAARAVDAWSPGASPLAAGTPLHLSDAPPDSTAPSTLFTAFSWPDARIPGRADGWLQDSMIELLHPGEIRGYPAVRDNDWTVGGGGNVFCPPVPIVPLTDDLDVVRSAADGLQTTDRYWGGGQSTGATYMNLGVVWGLRTLSPLWQGVWDVRDVRDTRRPAVPCAPGERAAGCDPSLRKSILLLSDGANVQGWAARSRLRQATLPRQGVRVNPSLSVEPRCLDTDIPKYHEAAAASDAAAFNAYFRAPHVAADLVDADGRLNALGSERLVNALIGFAGGRAPGYPEPEAVTDERRDDMLNTLQSAASGAAPTPWQLFRGLDADVIDGLVHGGFPFDGRPGLIDHRCRPWSTFSPYGRVDDLVYVGEDALTPPLPVADVAPFEIASLPESIVGDGSPGTFQRRVQSVLTPRLDEWLLAACRVAGARGVRVNVVFIGNPAYNADNIALLEQCVDSAGGDADTDDVFISPSSEDLTAAFQEIFTIRRNLRFLN